MGVGDWLLGYTDPTPIEGVCWNALVKGYMGSYNLLRPVVSMVFGFFGVLSYAPCMWGMGQIFKETKTKRMESIFMIVGMGGWALLHYLYSAMIYLFAFLCRYRDGSTAILTLNSLYDAVMPGMSLWLLLMLLPFLLHFFDIARGSSLLPRKMLIFHPLVWWAILYTLPAAICNTAFTNGLKTFAMNGSMLIWLTALLIYGKDKR